jgi:predicted GNAT family acetyltransferase
MVLMHLNRGDESHIDPVQAPSRLDVEDSDEVASLLRRCFPERYSNITSEQLRQRWQSNAYWLGIKHEKRLVSVGGTRFYFEFATNISTVATDEHYRCRGYATSIVSALVQEIFQRSPIALIHVMADNAPAVKAYSNVGFKPYKTYLSIRS